MSEEWEMSQQGVLPVYEDELDALRDAVRVLGGAKVVGLRLRPDLKDRAGAWLKDCLNAERREKLELSQVLQLIRLAHDVGHHGPALFLAAEMGYQAAPIEPADESAALQRAFIASVKTQQAILARMESLQGLSNVTRFQAAG